MKITFIGNFTQDHCSEVHYKKTFEKLGHTVIPCQENRTTVKEIMDSAVSSDFLFWVHTHRWSFGESSDVIKMLSDLKALNIPTVGFHLDLWLGLEREKDLKTDPYWNIQHFFTVDKLFAAWLNENTQTKGYYLEAGCFEDESYLAEPNHEKYPEEIVFTGSRTYHHEHPYRVKLIDWLHQTYWNRFAHYGGGGGRSTIRGHELNVLYASAKIAIGDTLCINFNYPFYKSDRIYEQSCRGAFQIFPYIQGIEDSFVIGKEIITYTFDDFIELKSLIDYYIENTEEREAIRIAGHNRAKKDHTYSVRLKTLLEILFGNSKESLH